MPGGTAPIHLACAEADTGGFAGLEALRAAASEIAGGAELVAIDPEAVASCASGLLEERRRAGEAPLEAGIWYSASPDGARAFALVADCVNFGSGYFPGLKKDSSKSGYKTMAAGLAEFFESNWPFPPSRLGKIGGPAIAHILGQGDEPSAEALELVAMMQVDLAEFGAHLRSRFADSFAAMAAVAGRGAEALVQALYELGAYRDGYRWKGILFQPAKKAQITASDLALVERHIARYRPGGSKIPGLDRLTAFADNSVPQVLEADGVLRYREDLAMLIASGSELEYGSQAEIEIRACTISAVERLSEATRAELTPAEIDALLWNRKHDPAREPHYRRRPSHKTRCHYY